MSYRVLSRKWRPQQFEEVIGQSHVTQTLQNAMKLDRIAHGYIFTGPRGVGKTTVARILAKVLNCTDSEDQIPCNTCQNCIEITEGRSMDVLELDGASNRGIDEIRDLRESIKYPPGSGEYRIYIIDEVHMLTKEAFNALLKTLEEPPPHVVFILATTDPHKVPQTILSRTQRFDFRRISLVDISEHLDIILNKESIEFDNEVLSVIAQKADGSIRDSLSLLDQVIAYSADKITQEHVRSVLGVINETVFSNLLNYIINKNSALLIEYLNDLLNSGHSINDFISGFNGFLRNCLIFSAGAGTHLDLSDDIKSLLTEKTVNYLDVLRMLDMCLKFETKLRYSQQPRATLESLFLKLSAMDSSIILRDIIDEKIKLQEPDKVQKKTPPKIEVETKISDPKPKAITMLTDSIEKVVVSEPIPSVDEPEITLDTIKSNWENIVNQIEKGNSKIAQFLEEIILENYSDSILTIKLENGHRFQIKSLENDSDKIEKIISTIMNVNIKLKIETTQTVNPDTEEPQKKMQSDKEHPLFMKALESFDGELLR